MYKKIFDKSENQVLQMGETFDRDSQKFQNIVVCLNCGSTNIDQNSITELRCYNCNTTMFWNGLRLSILRRERNAPDLRDAVGNLSRSSYDEWHQEVESGLYHYLEILIRDARKRENFTRDRLEELEREWTHCKKVVDMYFNDRTNYDEELDG